MNSKYVAATRIAAMGWLVVSSAMASGNYEDVIRASGPIAFYEMNGDGVALNSISPGTYDGTYGAGGSAVSSLSFPGTPFVGVQNQYLMVNWGYVGKVAIQPISNMAFTVEFLAKDLTCHTNTDVNYLFSKGTHPDYIAIGVRGTYPIPGINQGEIYIETFGNAFYGGGPVLGADWNHIALTYDGASNIVLYLNGSAIITVTNSGAADGVVLWGYRNRAGYEYPSTAWLADASVHASALNAATIGNHYVASTNVAPKKHYKEFVQEDGPRYYYTFDQWSTASDGGSAYSTTNWGMASGGLLLSSSFTNSCPMLSTNNAKGMNLGWTFALTNFITENWYSYKGGSSLNDALYTNWAVECWVYADSTMTPGGNYAIMLMNDGGGSLYFGYDPVEGKVKLGSGYIQSMTMDTWHHFVLAGTPSQATLILDGNVGGKTTVSVTVPALDARSPAYLRIGAWSGGGNLFKGKIDELAIYNLNGLTPAEYDAKLARIARHYSVWNPPSGTVISIW